MVASAAYAAASITDWNILGLDICLCHRMKPSLNLLDLTQIWIISILKSSEDNPRRIQGIRNLEDLEDQLAKKSWVTCSNMAKHYSQQSTDLPKSTFLCLSRIDFLYCNSTTFVTHRLLVRLSFIASLVQPQNRPETCRRLHKIIEQYLIWMVFHLIHSYTPQVCHTIASGTHQNHFGYILSSH